VQCLEGCGRPRRPQRAGPPCRPWTEPLRYQTTVIGPGRADQPPGRCPVGEKLLLGGMHQCSLDLEDCSIGPHGHILYGAARRRCQEIPDAFCPAISQGFPCNGCGL
jgi:hypothetical protein